MLERFSKSYKLSNKEKFVEKLINFSVDQDYFILLNSNNNSDKYDLLCGYGIKSFIKSSENSLTKLDNFFELKKDWLFGYMTYDLRNEIEVLNDDNIDFINMPNLHFFQPEIVWFVKGKNVTGLSFEKDLIENDWKKFNEISEKEETENSNIVKLNLRNSKSEYINKVNKIKERIFRGDCYEMNFCFDLFSEYDEINPYDTYVKLNNYTKSPMSSFLKVNDLFLISSSPERFLSKNGEDIISQPIKGTAKRGDSPEEDKKNINELLSSPKELSENHMIVDLVRNDLSRIAKKGSVKVKSLNTLKTFKRVHQLISTIEAKVSSKLKLSEILKGTFPMGSMTGAPKIESMNIIDEFESTKRGLYSGSVGYINPEMDFDFNVVIRSIVYSSSNKVLTVNVGSAITHKSIAEKEYEECLVKAEPMIQSLK